ncbi:MAG: sialate O-acetylesterase [Phycisphaeraceae bacterium]
MLRVVYYTVLLLSLACSPFAQAEIRLAKIFTDHMVLQQEMPIRIWGWADPGEQVTASFAGKTGSTKAKDDGSWRIDLPAMKSDGKTYSLKIQGSSTIELKDIVLGEVWIAAGQSNMNREVRIEGDHPGIRLYWLHGAKTPTQRDFGDNALGWSPATQQSLETFLPARQAIHKSYGMGTAEVGWVFGKRVHETMDVPVGVIKTAFGGSQARAWTPIENFTEKYSYGKEEEGGYIGHRPGLLYNTMLQWLGPMSVRGVVWYQGENNGRDWDYDQELNAMIAAWRELFEQPDMPFYLAQIGQTSYASNMLRVWECQAKVSADDPDTYLGMSVNLYDAVNGKGATRIHEDTEKEKGTGWPLAGSSNPHPPNKHIVANRLADLAMVNTYGKDLNKEVHAPRYASHRAEGNKLIVTFTNVGDGLKTDDGKVPDWFEISDGSQAERKGEKWPLIYHQASAKIIGKDTVELTATGIDRPTYVRLGWHTYARQNLVNSSGLPVVNFRTDTQQTKAR